MGPEQGWEKLIVWKIIAIKSIKIFYSDQRYIAIIYFQAPNITIIKYQLGNAF